LISFRRIPLRHVLAETTDPAADATIADITSVGKVLWNLQIQPDDARLLDQERWATSPLLLLRERERHRSRLPGSCPGPKGRSEAPG